jgi:hypothetical protein
MLKLISVTFLCIATVLASAQTLPSEWQRGTVTAVITHVSGPGERASDVAQYDVSIKVGNTIYVVLYAPPNGADTVQYAPGVDLLVLVGSDTLTFNSKLSGTTELLILRKQVLSAESGLDLSKNTSQYFSVQLQHLSEVLNLSEEQQSKTRPILEQETAEVGQIWRNPALTREEKLNRYEKIVRSSDKKLKPFLSNNQAQKLDGLRKEQKQELKRVSAEQKQKQAELR